jgi:CRISPR-associated exonuclease Cas4
MHITGTHFAYFLICRRKLWLFANNLQMEQESDLVLEGKLLHETAYPNRSKKFKEIEIGGVKIDFYDTRTKLIHEIKKSDKMEESHIWQVKYYIFILQSHGIDCRGAVIEYPKLRQTNDVMLSVIDIQTLGNFQKEITDIIQSDTCPAVKKTKACTNCAYHDFCFVSEPDEF